MYIYETTNLVNGKKYRGKSESKKFNPSYHGSGTIVRLAINKYGAENFKTVLIEECDSKEQLCEREKYWIDDLRKNYSSDMIYNIADGGHGGWEVINRDRQRKHDIIVKSNSTRIVSEETKRKNSESQKKLWTKERRELQAEIMRRNNAKRTKDDLEKIANKLRGKKHTEESRLKMSIAQKGKKKKPMSEETKRKISDAMKGRVFSEETRKKLSESAKGNQNNKGRKFSEETRRRMSESAKGRKMSDITKEKLRNCFKGKIRVVNKFNKIILIKPEELDKYINSGWKRGVKYD